MTKLHLDLFKLREGGEFLLSALVLQSLGKANEGTFPVEISEPKKYRLFTDDLVGFF